MKNEQIKEITSKAIEQLIATLNEGRSETLTAYLAAMAGFMDLCSTCRRDPCSRGENSHGTMPRRFRQLARYPANYKWLALPEEAYERHDMAKESLLLVRMTGMGFHLYQAGRTTA